MRLRYTDAKGKPCSFSLGDQPVTIGRSPTADIVIVDDKASRLHCGIRKENDSFHIKDLNSKNGTYVNNEIIHSAELSTGDRIRIGSTSIVFEDDASSAGTTEVFNEMEEEISKGKGYDTLLKEIVREASTGKTDTPEKK